MWVKMVLGTVVVAEDALGVVTGSLGVLTVSAAEGCEAVLTYRQCLCVGFPGFTLSL